MRDPAPKGEAILYAKQEVNGIIVRPDSKAVMLKAITETRMVIVLSENDYMNLYHVFERMQNADLKLKGIKLARRKVGPSKWLLWTVANSPGIPDVKPEHGYNPKRGRYKRYAERLAADESITLHSRDEAAKAQLAWYKYVPPEKRTDLRSTITQVSKGEFVLATARLNAC
jgi:hypothetical protein